jgi:hypothetical protein
MGLLEGWILTSRAHQDPCHRLHSCPSDPSTYVSGDTGRCEQCPENQYCLVGKPRTVSTPSPAPTPLAPSSGATTTPLAVTVRFTPRGNCTDALGDAKRMVLVRAYSFTSAPIAKALGDAHQRGGPVQALMDKSQRTEQYSFADFLADQGVPTTVDAECAIADNTIIVIDGEIVKTGSVHFTKAAQGDHAEHVPIVRDNALAARYTHNWQAHRQHGQPYVGRGVGR